MQVTIIIILFSVSCLIHRQPLGISFIDPPIIDPEKSQVGTAGLGLPLG